MQQQFDSRNAAIQVWVGDRLLPRVQAKVSVFDSVVQGGDAVWEGLRIYAGKVGFLEEHLDRLMASAHALMFEGVPSREEVRAAVFATLTANQMFDQAHIRLTLTRGEKITSGMDPRLNQSGCCLIVLAEWKAPVYGKGGIRLATSATRRNSPATLDSKIHHNNLLNNILAKIEANLAGVDDALMLDLDGFVAEANATNIFLVKNNRVLTSHATACLPGITRKTVLALAAEAGLGAGEQSISLTELYTADEAFVTGTMGELVPVYEVDGRQIGTGQTGPITAQLQQQYQQYVQANATPIPV